MGSRGAGSILALTLREDHLRNPPCLPLGEGTPPPRDRPWTRGHDGEDEAEVGVGLVHLEADDLAREQAAS